MEKYLFSLGYKKPAMPMSFISCHPQTYTIGAPLGESVGGYMGLLYPMINPATFEFSKSILPKATIATFISLDTPLYSFDGLQKKRENIAFSWAESICFTILLNLRNSSFLKKNYHFSLPFEPQWELAMSYYSMSRFQNEQERYFLKNFNKQAHEYDVNALITPPKIGDWEYCFEPFAQSNYINTKLLSENLNTEIDSIYGFIHSTKGSDGGSNKLECLSWGSIVFPGDEANIILLKGNTYASGRNYALCSNQTGLSGKEQSIGTRLSIRRVSQLDIRTYEWLLSQEAFIKTLTNTFDVSLDEYKSYIHNLSHYETSELQVVKLK